MFQSELMTCVECSFKQRSRPAIESGWFKIVADSVVFCFCPECMGAPAPKCPACNRFYHERYGAKCPFCGHTKRLWTKGFGKGGDR